MNTMDRIVLYTLAAGSLYVAWKVYPLARVAGSASDVANTLDRFVSIFQR